jgi:lysophospholipase L1-like esterase
MALIFGKNEKVLMIGDSITDCGRARPVGEGAGLGQGYVVLVDALLGSHYPEHGLRIVNMGTSGNQVRHLGKRWQTDVLDLKPDWLSIMIGINDVWRRFDSPLRTEEHVSLGEFEERLESLVSGTKDRVKGIILMSPYFLEPNRADPMRKAMDDYGAAVKRIATQHGTRFVDTQAAFDAILAHTHPMNLAWDRIHPGATGHAVLARAFLDTVGFQWDASGPPADPISAANSTTGLKC